MASQDAIKLVDLAKQLNSLEQVAVARALHDLNDLQLPRTAAHAAVLRRSNVVATVAVLVEPSWDGLLRTQACGLIARMSRLDFESQEAFLAAGVVRKLIKAADTAQHGSVDAGQALRALARVVGGSAGAPVGFSSPAVAAAVEDLFLSGMVHRMRVELSARRPKPDDEDPESDETLAAIGEFLASVASNPASHVRLADAGLLPLLPERLRPDDMGAPFVEAVHRLSQTEALCLELRSEAMFDALHNVVTAAETPNVRRTGLLALCNLYGGDEDHVRAEELLRMHSAPAMLTSLLAASLGPDDVGAAARGAAAAAAAATGGAQRRNASRIVRRSGSSNATSSAVSAAAEPSTASQGGNTDVSLRMSESGAARSPGPPGRPQPSGRSTGPRVSDEGPPSRQATSAVTDSGMGGSSRAGSGSQYGGPSMSSITSPGEGVTPNSSTRQAFASPEGSAGSSVTKYDFATVSLDSVLHSLKCVSASPNFARRLAMPGSSSFVLPRLLDTVIASHAAAGAGNLPRVTWVQRAHAAVQTLLRMASCPDLASSLSGSGVGVVLRLLAAEPDDARVGEAARAALLHLGVGGQVNAGSRASLAAYQALYGTGAPGQRLPTEQLTGRFSVFISHHRADAQSFALYTLHPLLLRQGVPTFVDPQHRTLSSDWAHVVSSCRNLLIVLSELLLSSPEHVHEAEAAVAAGVHCVAVVPEGARWPDAHGNRVFDSPPPSVLDTLPDRLRGVFADRPLVYSSGRHGEFTEQLMARLRLPPQPPGRQHLQTLGEGAAEGEGARISGVRITSDGGEGEVERDSGGGRVSRRTTGCPGSGSTARVPAEEGRPCRASSNSGIGHVPDHEADGPPALPWPWCRLMDPDEEQPMALAQGQGPGLLRASGCGGTVRESVSGSQLRMPSMSSAATNGSPGMGAAAAALGSHASRRHTARQRSSIHRQQQAALQQQQQQWVVQQQWLREYQQQQEAQAQHTQQHRWRRWGRHTSQGTAPDLDVNGGGWGSFSGPGYTGVNPGQGGDSALPPPSVVCQLLAVQLEMVRYEIRQAVQQSQEDVAYKIDRLRSDVTEQVVQLRFDLAGKIEALQDALKAATAAANARGNGSISAASSVTNHNGSIVNGSGTSQGQHSGQANGGSKVAVAAGMESGDGQSQQLAAALSSSIAASLQEAVARAVAQLQATVTGQLAGQLGPMAGAPAPASVATPANARSGASPAQNAQNAGVVGPAQASMHQPHPPVVPNLNGRPGGAPVAVSSILAGANGAEVVSPITRAATAAWSQEGAVLHPMHSPASSGANGPGSGGAKARSGNPNLAGQPSLGGGTAPAKGMEVPALPFGSITSAQAIVNAAAAAAAAANAGRSGPGPGPSPAGLSPLAVFDAAVAEDERAVALGGDAPTFASPSALLASVTSPATAQAALLAAGRGRQHVSPRQGQAGPVTGSPGGGHGGAGTAGTPTRGGSSKSPGALPPLTGLAASGRPLSPTSTHPSPTPLVPPRLVERSEPGPVRKSQQMMMLMQH